MRFSVKSLYFCTICLSFSLFLSFFLATARYHDRVALKCREREGGNEVGRVTQPTLNRPLSYVELMRRTFRRQHDLFDLPLSLFLPPRPAPINRKTRIDPLA